jgi:TatD DNase family protein
MNNQLYIDVHTHASSKALSDTFRVINLFAGEMPDRLETNTKFSVGLHPWHIDTESREQKLPEVEYALQNPEVIAVGETGLDKVIKVPMEIQTAVFLDHLKLAGTYNKPVIIHAVKSFFEIIEIYKKSGVKVPLIFHGFAGNKETAGQLLKYNVFFSFGKDLLSEKKKVLEAFQFVPAERLFFETDDSQLSIQNIYEKASLLRETAVKDLKEQIYQNFHEVFDKV